MFLCKYVGEKNDILTFSFDFAQLTNPFCSKLDISFLSFFCFDFESFVIAHVQIVIFCHFQHLCYPSCLDGMLCVYKGNDKKKFTNLNLKEIRHEAEKELEHLFSSLLNTQ